MLNLRPIEESLYALRSHKLSFRVQRDLYKLQALEDYLSLMSMIIACEIHHSPIGLLAPVTIPTLPFHLYIVNSVEIKNVVFDINISTTRISYFKIISSFPPPTEKIFVNVKFKTSNKPG